MNSLRVGCYSLTAAAVTRDLTVYFVIGWSVRSGLILQAPVLSGVVERCAHRYATSTCRMAHDPERVATASAGRARQHACSEPREAFDFGRPESGYHEHTTSATVVR